MSGFWHILALGLAGVDVSMDKYLHGSVLCTLYDEDSVLILHRPHLVNRNNLVPPVTTTTFYYREPTEIIFNMGVYGGLGPMTNAVLWVEAVIFAIFVGLRLYTRKCILDSVGFDDYLVLIALLRATFYIAVLYVQALT